jgi:carbon monoxide dehydrogenase subunit G
MDVAGEYTFDAPQQIVWNALRDPDVLGTVLPGGEGIAEIGENEYEGQLKIKVGPVQGKFKGNIKLENINPPDSYDITVNGKGAPGFVKGSGTLILTPEVDAQKTHMVYSGTAQVGGRIASVGQRLLDASSKSIIRQSLDALNAYVVAQIAAQSGGEAEKQGVSDEPAAPSVSATVVEQVAETVETITTLQPHAEPPPPKPKVNIPDYTPPTQSELALNVAKDVLDDFVPERWQPIVVAAIVSFLTTLFLNLFRRK